MDCNWGDVDAPEEKYPERPREDRGAARYIPMADINRAVVDKLV